MSLVVKSPVRRKILLAALRLAAVVPFSGLLISKDVGAAEVEIDLHAQKKDTSAQLKLSSMDVGLSRFEYTISGDGHTHPVQLNQEALDLLKSKGFVVVKSGLSTSVDKHRHWVYISMN